jgi:hypothetical protein
MKSHEKQELRTEPENLQAGNKIFAQSATLSPQSLEVHIEALVLYGFAPGDRYRIGEAVERELTRLFGEQGVPSSLVRNLEVSGLDGNTFEVVPGSKAAVIGTQIARMVYQGLSR